MGISIISTDECFVIRMTGRFDTHCRMAFLEAAEKAVADNACEIQIDLGSVDYLDSTALGLLLLIRDKTKGLGKKVTLANAHGSVKQVLDIAKFDKIFGATNESGR